MPPPDRFLFNMESDPDPDVLEQGRWIEVEGGGMSDPIFVRIGRSPDDRPIITGLLMGQYSDAEITADTLRDIRPRPLLTQLFEDFDHDKPPVWPSNLTEITPNDVHESILWGLMYRDVWLPAEKQQGPGAKPKKAPGSRGPSTEDLRKFAKTYLRERRHNPGRAMTATAEAMRVSRATANRWAALCREQRLLPPKTNQPDGTQQQGEDTE